MSNSLIDECKNVCLPWRASDYLDMSGYEGRGSVAGIVDGKSRIVVGYGASLTYEQAKAIAEAVNIGKGLAAFIQGLRKRGYQPPEVF